MVIGWPEASLADTRLNGLLNRAMSDALRHGVAVVSAEAGDIVTNPSTVSSNAATAAIQFRLRRKM